MKISCLIRPIGFKDNAEDNALKVYYYTILFVQGQCYIILYLHDQNQHA